MTGVCDAVGVHVYNAFSVCLKFASIISLLLFDPDLPIPVCNCPIQHWQDTSLSPSHRGGYLTSTLQGPWWRKGPQVPAVEMADRPQDHYAFFWREWQDQLDSGHDGKGKWGGAGLCEDSDASPVTKKGSRSPTPTPGPGHYNPEHPAVHGRIPGRVPGHPKLRRNPDIRLWWVKLTVPENLDLWQHLNQQFQTIWICVKSHVPLHWGLIQICESARTLKTQSAIPSILQIWYLSFLILASWQNLSKPQGIFVSRSKKSLKGSHLDIFFGWPKWATGAVLQARTLRRRFWRFKVWPACPATHLQIWPDKIDALAQSDMSSHVLNDIPVFTIVQSWMCILLYIVIYVLHIVTWATTLGMRLSRQLRGKQYGVNQLSQHPQNPRPRRKPAQVTGARRDDDLASLRTLIFQNRRRQWISQWISSLTQPISTHQPAVFGEVSSVSVRVFPRGSKNQGTDEVQAGLGQAPGRAFGGVVFWICHGELFQITTVHYLRPRKYKNDSYHNSYVLFSPKGFEACFFSPWRPPAVHGYAKWPFAYTQNDFHRHLWRPAMMGPLARRWTLGAGLVKLEVSSDGFAVCYFNKVLKIAAFLFRDRFFFDPSWPRRCKN